MIFVLLLVAFFFCISISIGCLMVSYDFVLTVYYDRAWWSSGFVIIPFSLFVSVIFASCAFFCLLKIFTGVYA